MSSRGLSREADPLLPVVVCGAGPAGLTAAHHLAVRGLRPLVLEAADKVGGIARTEKRGSCRFDIGGHRFFTREPGVERIWRTMLGDDLMEVERISRILYKGHFFHYPIELKNTLRNLGLRESFLVMLSYLRAKLRPPEDLQTFEEWAVSHFGERLYLLFFKTYTEKVWGIPCRDISAEWASQRIKGVSLRTAVVNALFGTHEAKSWVRRFLYPVLGPGMMWERFREEAERRGGEVLLRHEALRFRRRGERVVSVATQRDGENIEIPCRAVISTLALPDLIDRIDPPPPPGVREAAARLRFRDFILVGLVLERTGLFEDQWIYVHTPDVKVGRIQNFGNWSAAMAPAPGTTSLGMEYFCSRGDFLWEMTDEALVELAKRELESLGLARAAQVREGAVFRQPRAYPVYLGGYREDVAVIRRYLGTLENLQSVGRNGMHRYNNMDHSMIAATAAAERLLGRDSDPWEAGDDEEYLEAGAAREGRE